KNQKYFCNIRFKKFLEFIHQNILEISRKSLAITVGIFSLFLEHSRTFLKLYSRTFSKFLECSKTFQEVKHFRTFENILKIFRILLKFLKYRRTFQNITSLGTFL